MQDTGYEKLIGRLNEIQTELSSLAWVEIFELNKNWTLHRRPTKSTALDFGVHVPKVTNLDKINNKTGEGETKNKNQKKKRT